MAATDRMTAGRPRQLTSRAVVLSRVPSALNQRRTIGVTSTGSPPWSRIPATRVSTTTTLNTITVPSSNDPSHASAIRRIGDWDGTPSGFKNADLMTYAHPSDVRAASWTGNVVIGSGSETSAFPCYLWKDVNSGLLVHFRLAAAQAAAAHTLRIGVPTAYAGGRPQITVNDTWSERFGDDGLSQRRHGGRRHRPARLRAVHVRCGHSWSVPPLQV
ncbi:hypothetical protein SRB17_66130 [Streptomyces sp. RB17]|nr:hypothetical protein [Streptomyces sp. RB17]